ncbi:hypothetical protein F5887DRAFT_1081225 [Amanita rubescens]|nr:hypothetical protein F5887DRAFT_1081225 [Amanita rubescens]
MPSSKGRPKTHLRVSYTAIADDPVTTAINQILALLERSDAILHSAESLPDFNTQPLSGFLSQPGRAHWGFLSNKEGAPAGKASDVAATQGSSELRALAKQVQAINSKMGTLQAYIQKPNKSYAAVAASDPPGQATKPKVPRELLTRARLVLVPQVPLDATFDANEMCQYFNQALANPTTFTASRPNVKWPLPLVPSTARISAVNRMAKGNMVIIGGLTTTSQQLTDALPYIKPVLEYGAGISVETFSGTKWRRVCINGVPTPPEGPAYTPGVIATQLKLNNLWSNKLRMPIQPYWIRPPSTIEKGCRSTVVLTFEDEEGTVQQGVLRQRKAFLFGRTCTMRPWTEKKPTGINQKKSAPVAPTAS